MNDRAERYLTRAAEDFVDAILRNEDKQYPLHDVLEGELDVGAELGRIFKAARPEQQGLVDDLEARSRKVVERFVVEHCAAECRAAAEEAAIDADPRNEYEPVL